MLYRPLSYGSLHLHKPSNSGFFLFPIGVSFLQISEAMDKAAEAELQFRLWECSAASIGAFS